MTEGFEPVVEEPKKNNTTLIIAIIVIVVLCCCCVFAGAIWYLWTYGDQIFGLTQNLVSLLA